jgi:hypothetical protein
VNRRRDILFYTVSSNIGWDILKRHAGRRRKLCFAAHETAGRSKSLAHERADEGGAVAERRGQTNDAACVDHRRQGASRKRGNGAKLQASGSIQPTDLAGEGDDLDRPAPSLHFEPPIEHAALAVFKTQGRKAAPRALAGVASKPDRIIPANRRNPSA